MNSNGVLKQKRQLFPDKLWDLVSNQPSSGIHWSKNGKRIEIDRAQLEKFLQSRLLDRTPYQNTQATPASTSTKFRSHNFDSFIRQLHFYGFKKAGNSYYHDKFQRDRPEALSTMKRKYSSLGVGVSSQNQTISTMLPRTPNTDANTSNNGQSSQVASSSSTSHLMANEKQHAARSEREDQLQSSLVNSNLSPSGSLSSSSVSTISSLSNESSSAATTVVSTPRKQQKTTCSTDTIKMYTIDSTGCDNGQISFANVREASVKAIRNEKSVKISIPDLMLNNHSDDSWPKTLVIENQKILSAYFIYKLN